MLRFEGERDCPLPPGEVFARLTDARFLVQCLPDVESVRESNQDQATFRVRPALSFVRGALDVTLTVLERNQPQARFLLTSKGIGSGADVESALEVSEQGTGTHLHWSAEVKNLTGLLKLVPAGLIRGAAEKAINDVWDRLMAAVQG
jgi:carbon monoxide dehydrogenase subunit G